MNRGILLGLACATARASFAINYLQNPGFESTPSFDHWTTNAPASLEPLVESTVVHSGTHAVLMPMDYYIDQEFAAVPVSSIQNVSYWIKQDQFQPNPTYFSANILYYQDGSNTYVVPRPANNGGWANIDLTRYLVAGKSLVGIRVYGATSLGFPSPKTYFDDFNVGSPVPVPEPATLFVLGLPALGLVRRLKHNSIRLR